MLGGHLFLHSDSWGIHKPAMFYTAPQRLETSTYTHTHTHTKIIFTHSIFWKKHIILCESIVTGYQISHETNLKYVPYLNKLKAFYFA